MVRKHWSGENILMRRRRVRCRIALLAFLPLILFGCRSNQDPAEYLYGVANVDTVEIRIQETRPGGATAIVHGTLLETCTEVDEIRQDYDGGEKTFVLTLTTRRPVDASCEREAVAFEESIPLAIERLPDGTYVVVANGVAASFELDREALAPIE